MLHDPPPGDRENPRTQIRLATTKRTQPPRHRLPHLARKIIGEPRFRRPHESTQPRMDIGEQGRERSFISRLRGSENP